MLLDGHEEKFHVYKVKIKEREKDHFLGQFGICSLSVTNQIVWSTFSSRQLISKFLEVFWNYTYKSHMYQGDVRTETGESRSAELPVMVSPQGCSLKSCLCFRNSESSLPGLFKFSTSVESCSGVRTTCGAARKPWVVLTGLQKTN